MKVRATITCAECGERLEVVSFPEGETRAWLLLPKSCPKCAPPEPTYGPITVEMVKEMFYEARRHPGDVPYPQSSYSSGGGVDESETLKARAVIRLLNHLGDGWIFAPNDFDWHAKLLEIAGIRND